MAVTEIDALHFRDARELGVQGRAFEATERFYSRLPLKARGVVPDPVWGLAQKAAGLFVDFWTDSPVLGAELTLEGAEAVPGANRDCTIDAYAHDGLRWGWIGNLFPLTSPPTRGIVRLGLPPVRRLYRVHLPHGASVAALRLGVAPGARLEAAAPGARKPVCCYGTSIVHGFQASRAGMTMPAQLARRLGRAVWNFGFAGNARMEPALAELFAELDPAVYTIDCLPNMTPEWVRERTAPFVRRLRAARPETPIVLVENIVYQATYMLEDRRGGWGPKNDALAGEYARLLGEGTSRLYYLTGHQLLGTDGDGATDGTHPTDLGMFRLTDAYEAAVRPLLD